MKSHKLLLAALAFGSVCMSSCKDDWAEMNMKPDAVVQGNISYLYSEAVMKFNPFGYLEYYYHAPMKYAWAGMGLPTGGASESIITLTATGDQGSRYIETLKYVREIENIIENGTDDERLANAPYLHATKVLTVYLGIYDSDMYGALPYAEACRLKFDNVTVTPAYDMQETLYNTWLTELDEAVANFTAKTGVMTASQDVVFGGDQAKWAKFANSLKLRLAVRLLANNPTKAKEIAAEVENASCGYIDSLDDAVLFNKATVNNETDDNIYHWSNGFTGCVGTESVINLMVNNKDPRVRFFYQKNSWNSKIVQGFYDAGLEIPEFIEANVVSEVGADGKKKFVKWGGMGEPWVRYYGITEDWNAGVGGQAEYKWYFQGSYGKAATELTLYDAEGKNPTQYTTYSILNRMMINGRTYNAAEQSEAAALPGEGSIATFTTVGRPWYGMYMSAGEVNLYLAEFAMLNGNAAKAETYYNKALASSVEEYNKLAGLNQVAYHSSVVGNFKYDKNEAPIDLQPGEIEAMMKGAEYAFTGTDAEKLEKIYIQQMLHFTLYPNEVYVTARRSGYPSFNSTILARPNYAELPATSIPRRFPTGALTDTDKMKDVRAAAYAAQGLTVTSDGLYDSAIATERLWADTSAPAWGAGQ